ncbi:MAG: adenosylmethionine--8-amino-7-oxononanoate transaminase [Gammaproteobacteria bacterium]|nr:adenosylmethionine--8-amino-7-oxononanoate transaminase [Gammaproteobacteria bacterium]
MSKNNHIIVKRDLKVVWHPCTQMKDHEKIPLIPIKEGKGVWLKDYNNNKYIDAISSWWVNLFGHSNPYINKKIIKQLEKLEHVLLAGFTHMPALTLAERLISLSPKNISKCFFADNGSSAIDAAMKMSHHYWRNQGYNKKTKFISLSNSYHGETLGSLSVSNIDLYKKTYKNLMKDTIVVDTPDCYLKNDTHTDKEHTRLMFDKMLKAIEKNHKVTSAVILEPLVQCAGYMRMYHPIYLKLLREACDKYKLHLIADEIAVGFGRTGTMFAYEKSKITPDIICLSKGITGGYMTLSTILTNDNIYNAFYDEYIKLNAFLHSHSYAANPLACTAANASLDLFEKSNVINNNKILSEYILKSFAEISKHPNVSDVRQHGMITAIELVKNKSKKIPYNWKERRGLRAYEYGLKNNVLIRPLGNVIYFMPPYIIKKKEIDKVINVIHGAIDVATK